MTAAQTQMELRIKSRLMAIAAGARNYGLPPTYGHAAALAIKALAVGESITYARTFGGRKLTAEDYRRIAANVVPDELREVAAAIHTAAPRNPIMYGLACWAKYALKTVSRKSCAQNYIKHNYTQEQLKSILSDIDNFDDIEV
jgi:hypothetical protein